MRRLAAIVRVTDRHRPHTSVAVEHETGAHRWRAVHVASRRLSCLRAGRRAVDMPVGVASETVERLRRDTPAVRDPSTRFDVSCSRQSRQRRRRCIPLSAARRAAKTSIIAAAPAHGQIGGCRTSVRVCRENGNRVRQRRFTAVRPGGSGCRPQRRVHTSCGRGRAVPTCRPGRTGCRLPRRAHPHRYRRRAVVAARPGS